MDGELQLDVGAGGFGRVYLGLLNGVRQVAVKVITSHDMEQQARFIREIRTLKACLDPNIVQFLGMSVSERQMLMVMQVCSQLRPKAHVDETVNPAREWPCALLCQARARACSTSRQACKRHFLTLSRP